MSTHKHIDRICVAITVLALLLTVLFVNGESFGLTASARSPVYKDTLFDTSRVHTIDIVIDDWDSFLETAASEEYTACSVVIDNDAVRNVAIRGKGNTSLSSVSAMDSERYSFKIEFDHYENGKSYKGLDKLCLNNIIQDNTYMKDYLVYRLMAEFGVDAPLCSFVWVTVNGEDWGLYLAVEAIEDSFLQRTYNGSGEIYKPDSMSMGGGRGNGREFDMDAVLQELFGDDVDISELSEDEIRDKLEEVKPQTSGGFSGMPGGSPFGSGSGPEPGQFTPGGSEIPDAFGFSMPGGPEGSFPSETGEDPSGSDSPDAPADSDSSSGRRRPGGGPGGFPGGGMGSDDVKLRYIDDDPDSYSAIFDSAKTTVTDKDKARLISSLKQLSEQTNLEEVLDIGEVLRYFVVHNFTVNGDSYTGSMIHNYYLHEADGRLSMIPWDYNLAFGSFQGNNASGAVNDPIDTPQSVGSGDSRPMADWIFSSEEYTEQYHALFAEFLDSFDFAEMISDTAAMIAPYVEKDPTKFCTCEEFEKGVEALSLFCTLRTESVRGQLEGTIPSTDEGQNADPDALVDASMLTLYDLGTMNNGGGGSGFPGSNSGDFPEGEGFPGGSGFPDGNGFPGDGGFPGGDSFPGSSGFPGGDSFPGGNDFQMGESFSDSGGFPENAEPFGGPPQNGDGPSFGAPGFPGSEPGQASGEKTLTRSDLILLYACLIVLPAGILIVKKYRHIT